MSFLDPKPSFKESLLYGYVQGALESSLYGKTCDLLLQELSEVFYKSFDGERNVMCVMDALSGVWHE